MNISAFLWMLFCWELRRTIVKTQVSNTRPGRRIRPAASLYVAPDGFKDTWSPFLKEIEEKYSVLLFWRFRIKLIYIVILETFSNVQYVYTHINNNQMQREYFNHMFEEFLKCFRPFKTAAMMLIWPTVNIWHPWVKMKIEIWLWIISNQQSVLLVPWIHFRRRELKARWLRYLVSFNGVCCLNPNTHH